MKFSLRRIWGLIIRHLYAFARRWDKITDAFYWPTLDIITWGLTLFALERLGTSMMDTITMIIIAQILWYVIWRGQYEISVNVLEELWDENFGNLFTTPLTLLEWVLAMLILGFMKLILTVVFTAAVAYFVYAVNLFDLGISLLPFIANLLIMGWWVGLFLAGLFIRYGTNMQTLAWAGGFILMPFSAAYYPLSSLPIWMQNIAQYIPATYVFEGMRVVLATGRIPWGMITVSMMLNVFYFVLTLTYFVKAFRKAKLAGLAHIK